MAPRPRQQSPVLPEPEVEAEAAERRPPSPDPQARGALARLGAFCARRPALVIGAWLLLLAAALVGRHVAAPVFSDEITLSGTPSKTGADLLAASEPRAGEPNGKVVLHAGSGAVAAHGPAVDRTLAKLRELPHVTAVSAMVTSSEGRTAYTTVTFDVPTKSLGHDYTDRLDTATGPARADGLQVAYGGDLSEVVRAPANDRLSELVGLGTALLILLVGFGSVLAALLPLFTALISVGTGIGVVGVVAATVGFATAAPTLASMIGLGVGIDYALFLTTRFRQDLMEGRDPVDAAARTAHTSGRAVLVAALTVAVAMLSLYACGLTFIGKLGLAGTIAVVITGAAALTLVPAALGLVGRRIDRWGVRRPVAESTGENDAWYRYAKVVSRRPWLFLGIGTVVLAVCALPLLSMRLGHVDSGADKPGTSARLAYDWIADGDGPGFGPGANGPVVAVVDLRHAHASPSRISTDIAQALHDTHGVARFGPVTPSADGKVLVTTITPTTGPQDAATGTLLADLKDTALPDALKDTGAQAYLTGTTAGQADFHDVVSRRLPVVIGVVLVLAFLLLTAVFRSVVIPLKAVVLNLFTTAASYGILVAVFQWGWGDRLLDLSEPVPIESYVPMMLFAIVFGLSMDYEIFLLSRIAEAWRRTGDNRRSVSEGLSATARVISSAAFIMTAVFLAFTVSPTVVVKMLALGLAISVVLDATLVRLVLVPSAMFLLGRANWWMPRRLDRILPRMHA
ncbi:MMPL family transporter [Streptomyces sp. NPDC048664]|uniref:MMPL family transporter n=1 Tax=Streptomyces sp. NPDC048664 TaxID=3154505 RepID=UPI003425E217